MPKLSELIDIDDEIVPEVEAIAEELGVPLHIDRRVLDSFTLPEGFTVRVLSVDEMGDGRIAARIKVNEDNDMGDPDLERIFNHACVWVPVAYEPSVTETEKARTLLYLN